jgi:hypothetical protein
MVVPQMSAARNRDRPTEQSASEMTHTPQRNQRLIGMAITFRSYIFESGGKIKHIPRRVAEGLYLGDDALPEYAGTKQRVAEVVNENEGGKAARILDARGRYWVFDKEGKLEKDDAQVWFALREHDLTPKGKVVDLRPQLERNQWRSRNMWDLTKDDLDRVAAALWPGAVEDAEEVKAVKGTQPKRPPLTRDAQNALSEISVRVGDIGREMERLTEPGLKGLAHEARRTAKLYSENAPLWEGLANEANRRREIKARYRTGKGAWIAMVHVWHSNTDRSEMREIDTIQRRCETKQAAIEAARELLAQNAQRFSEDVTVDASIVSELEWSSAPDDE